MIPSRKRNAGNGKRRGLAGAFTLVELLLVIVIIAILLALTTPYILGAISGSKLTTAGEQVMSLLSSAQQIASSEGRSVEIRAFATVDSSMPGDGTPEYRSLALLRYYEAGEANPDPAPANSGKPLPAPISVIVGQVLYLPQGIVIANHSEASTLVTDPSVRVGSNSATGPPKVIRGGKMEDYTFQNQPVEMASFVVRADGTALDPAIQWCMTLTDSAKTGGESTPADWPNFFCIQLDPVNGRIVSYRP